MNKDIGARLRQLRLARGETEAVSAAGMGVFPTQLQEIEAGLARPRLETLVRAAELWGVSLDFIVRGTPGPGNLADMDEKLLLETYRRLPENAANRLLGYALGLAPPLEDAAE